MRNMSRYVWMSVICLTFVLASHGGKADSQQSAVEFMEENPKVAESIEKLILKSIEKE